MPNNLRFYRCDGAKDPARYLAERLKSALIQGDRLLWLVSGGSAITVAVQAAKLLNGRSLDNLTVSLCDERYGPVGQADSNWRQLINAGFKLSGAKLQPALSGADAVATTRAFSEFLGAALANSDYKIALLGIGVDGHTAGILPASPAVTSKEPAVYYETPQYNRISITPAGLAQLDEVVVYCVGESKHQPLNDLERDLPLATQPAQILKKIPRVAIFNDFKGEVI